MTKYIPLIYLASPYSHKDKNVRIKRFEEVSRIAGNLAAQGHVLICPIAMDHPMHKYADVDMPTDWEFWKRYDTVLLERCDELWVAKMDGWNKSVGVKAEIEYAKSLNIPVLYLDPITLTTEEV
jgi:hypothetical protein